MEMLSSTSASNSYQRILLTRLRFIGDIVLTTPMIRSLRKTFPNAYIAYLGEKEGVSLLQHNPYLNEIIPFDVTKKNPFYQLKIFKTLREKKFDLVIDLFGNPRSALLSYITGAPVRVGGDFSTRRKLYTVRVKDDGIRKTAIEFHFQFLRALGVSPDGTKTEIFLTEDEKREAKIFLHWNDIDLSKPVVGLHPGATWPAKFWVKERFTHLADLIAGKLNAKVLITQGPKEENLVSEISQRCVSNIVVLPVLPLRQLAAVLYHLNIYVANDSGPMHIAAAVGTKTIGIFGPGEEDIWFPYSRAEGHLALRKDVPCHPCHLDVCNRPGDLYMECMKLLSVEEVFEAVKERVEMVKLES